MSDAVSTPVEAVVESAPVTETPSTPEAPSIKEETSWDDVTETEAVEASQEADEWDLLEAQKAEEVEEVEVSEPESKEVEEVKEETSSEFQLPKELSDKGLLVKDGQVGKMVKIDGQEQFVSLDELGNDFSGQKAISKRFTEFDKQEKQFKAEMKAVNDYINDLGTTMRNESILGGVSKIAELVGFAPYQLQEALIKEIMPEIERRYGLSESELALELKQKENDHLRNQLESDNKKLTAEQAQKEFQSKISNLRETHKIDEDTWDQAITALDKVLPKDEPITPEKVVEYVGTQRVLNRAESIVKSFDNSYLSNNDVMEALVDSIKNNPTFSDDDFADILKTAFGDAKKQEVAQAVEKKLEKKETKVVKKKDTSPYKPITNRDGEEITDWDDLL